MSLSVSIMAHPKRKHLIPTLCKRLGVGFDRITWDHGLNDRWDTGRRALLAYDENATHHLVVQDDAVPARDLLAAVTRWIPQLPEGVLCLYAGRVGLFNQEIARVNPPLPSWLQMRKINWGVALVFPVQHIRPMVAYGDTRVEMENYDMRLSEYCVLNGLPVFYPYPSWVNHETTPSLVRGRSATRKAKLSLNASQSALQWSRRGAPIVPLRDFVRTSELPYPLLSVAMEASISTTNTKETP